MKIRNFKSKMRLSALMLGGAFFIGVLLYFFFGRHPQMFPPCFLHKLTGLYCPGCGGTRGAYCLTQLDLTGALRQNFLIYGISVPLLLLLYLQYLFEAPRLSGRPAIIILSAYLALALVFTIVRNIPCQPFSLLAPF